MKRRDFLKGLIISTLAPASTLAAGMGKFNTHSSHHGSFDSVSDLLTVPNPMNNDTAIVLSVNTADVKRYVWTGDMWISDPDRNVRTVGSIVDSTGCYECTFVDIGSREGIS